MISEFKTKGVTFSEAELQRIYTPCRLEIGVNTPEEIGMSLFSEILGVFSGNTGGMLREKRGPIHARD